jgi:hypothetical protein
LLKYLFFGVDGYIGEDEYVRENIFVIISMTFVEIVEYIDCVVLIKKYLNYFQKLLKLVVFFPSYFRKLPQNPVPDL